MVLINRHTTELQLVSYFTAQILGVDVRAYTLLMAIIVVAVYTKGGFGCIVRKHYINKVCDMIFLEISG